MAVTKRLRFEILRRDDFACRYCGAKAPDVELTVDHVTPKALGGQDTPDNLVAACRPCNTGKSSAGPDEHHVAQVADDALRWAAAMKRAAAEMTAQEAALGQSLRRFEDTWDGWRIGPEPGEPVPRPSDWTHSVLQLLSAGLPDDALLRAISIAMRNNRIGTDQVWRYFCGVAWRTLDDLQERAAQLLREGGTA